MVDRIWVSNSGGLFSCSPITCSFILCIPFYCIYFSRKEINPRNLLEQEDTDSPVLQWIWQMQDPDNRMSVLPGNAPIDDTIDLKWTAEVAKSYDLTNNIGGLNGQLCYIYV